MHILDRKINIYKTVKENEFCKDGYNDIANLIGADKLFYAKLPFNKHKEVTIRQLIEIFPSNYEPEYLSDCCKGKTFEQIWSYRALNIGFFIWKAIGGEECFKFCKSDGAVGIINALLKIYRETQKENIL